MSYRLPKSAKLVALPLVAFIVACQDSPPTAPGGTGPVFSISEARFGSGNPDLFFAPPLADTPSPDDPNFDSGAANGMLRPYVRVCETNGEPSADGCTVDVTEAVTGSASGLQMKYSSTGELYQVNWQTDALALEKAYRIEIWGVGFDTQAERESLLAVTFPDSDPLAGRPRWLFGWRDIANSPSVSACHGEEAYCLIKYGQNIPIKVRIEDYVLCPAARNCAVQFVSAGEDANLEAILEGEFATSVQLYIPGQAGTDFALGFEPCSPAEKAAVQAYSAIPTFGPCMKTLAPQSPVRLTQPALMSYCEQLDEQQILDQLAVPSTQHDLVGIHHFNTGGSMSGPILNMEAWRHAAPVCSQPTSGGFASLDAPEGFSRFAQATGRRFLSLFAPEPLRALDVGGGGEGWKLWSYFMLALPTKFEYERPGDALQRGVAGESHTLRAKATDVNGDPVWNARVDWTAVSSPGGDASVTTTPVLTGLDGIAQTAVTLSATEGDNVFYAGGRGIADDRESGCTIINGVPGAASCNGPSSFYDPFQPLASSADVTIIPEGTRLPFTVYGCVQGRGTAAVDGSLAAGEWNCANSTPFPAKLSGGSTVQGTLYWMNDNARLYLAVRVPGSARENALRIDWDNDGDVPALVVEGGSYATAREAGDDIWEFVPGSGAVDKFIDVSCSGSSQSGCGSADSGFGGGNQTSAAFNNTAGGFTTYEMSHPLTTTDLCTNADPRKGCGALLGQPIDLRGSAGEAKGFFLTLRLGSGAQGNTQWPGFLQYMKVAIK